MTDASRAGDELAVAISHALVRVITEVRGRRPTTARTTIGRDAVFVVVRDTLAEAEQQLIVDGDLAAVLRQREAWQAVMRESFNREVEQLTRRRVIGFMSANHVEPDVGVEVFILEPSEADAPVGEGGTA